MGISFAIMYLGNIEVINNILSGAVPTVKRIFSFLPINALNIIQVALVPMIKWGDIRIYCPHLKISFINLTTIIIKKNFLISSIQTNFFVLIL